MAAFDLMEAVRKAYQIDQGIEQGISQHKVAVGAHPEATQSLSGFLSAQDKSKLNGIASGANNYVHPTADGSLHVPATGTTSNGKVLKAGQTQGSLQWGTLTQQDVGAVSKTGDTMTGNLTTPKVLVSGAQGSEVNALTRKDYVDAQVGAVDAKNVAKAGDTMTGGLTAPTFTGALAGNAATATKLATARQINGTNFDGSGNITTANWGTARTLTIGDAAKSVNGAGNVSWSLAEIGALPVTGGTVGALGVITELGLVGPSAGDMADIVWKAPDGTERGRLWIGGTIGADNSLTWRSGASGGTYRIYHEGNKPTASDVGAAPAGFGLGEYGRGIGSVLGDTPLRRQSGFFQGSNIAGIPNGTGWTYLFNQAHGNAAGYFGYLAINFAGTQAWIGGQEGGTQKGPYELVKQGDRFVANNAVGNDYNQCAIEVNGNTAIDSRPGIGFHMAGRFAGMLHMWEGGDFRFHTQGLASYAGIMTGNVNANDVYIRSDRRLKKNLVEVRDALRKVSSLTAYSYDKKQTLEATEYDKKEVGLIAQDVEQVLPEAVTRVVDSSNKDGTEILTLSNSALIALLVGAVKELSEKVKELEYGRT